MDHIKKEHLEDYSKKLELVEHQVSRSLTRSEIEEIVTNQIVLLGIRTFGVLSLIAILIGLGMALAGGC